MSEKYWSPVRKEHVPIEDLTVSDLSFPLLGSAGVFLRWAEATHPAYLNNLKAGFIRWLQSKDVGSEKSE